MYSNVNLIMVGRGHWGKIYEKTVRMLTLQEKNNGINISLPNKNIYGKNYREDLKKINARDTGGVIIAVSTPAHYEVAAYLLKHGFHHLLIEKPLTQTSAQAKKLQKLVQTIPESLILVDHTLLYDPAYNRMMENVTRDKIGKILQIHYTSLKAPRIEGTTIIPDAGSPPIYLFMDIIGEKPTKISAKHTNYDNIELILEFDNGIRGIAHIGTIHPERKRELVIIGNRGRLILNEFMNPRELVYIDNKNQKKNLLFPTDKTSLQLVIVEFITCITQKKKPRTPLSSGIDVVEIIELAKWSLKNGGIPVNIV